MEYILDRTAKESNNNNWLDGLKEVFSIEGLNEDELKDKNVNIVQEEVEVILVHVILNVLHLNVHGQVNVPQCSGYYTKSTNSNGVCYKDKIAGSGMECCTGE